MAPSLREVALFLHALRLARRAQDVERLPVPAVVEALSRLRGVPRRVDPQAALRATLRATSRGERWFGWRGTCLVRALVLSALVAGRGKVELLIGVRRGEGEAAVDGHAWVRVDGAEVSLAGPAEAGDEGFAPVAAIPVTHPPQRRSAATA